jgi:hypothetical protein
VLVFRSTWDESQVQKKEKVQRNSCPCCKMSIEVVKNEEEEDE